MYGHIKKILPTLDNFRKNIFKEGKYCGIDCCLTWKYL